MFRSLSYKRICCFLLAVMVLCFCGCAGQVPADESISDVRIFVEPQPASSLDQGYTLLRICYGSYSNGRWYDRPSEDYALKSIFSPKQTTGYQAAGKSHLVKIGPYLIICIANMSYDQDPETTVRCEITDTLGSKVEEPFSEYSTKSFDQTDGQQYGYIKKDGLNDTQVEYCFRHYYFLVLEYAALPADYVLECTFTSARDTVTETLTYDDIMQLLSD